MSNRTKFPLNKAQAAAVHHRDGPLLVVAGAGTGKTRVIVERIASLIDQGVKAAAILALTFTEKAAAEMLDRLNHERGGYTLDTTIATYNSFGHELLEQYASEIGLGNLRLLGETGQLVFMREHLDSFKLDYFAPVSRPDSQLSLIADYISSLKQQLVTPSDYSAFVKSLPNQSEEEHLEKTKHQELANAYNTYIELCRNNNVMDFDDQLYLTIDLLKRRPNILKVLQGRFHYILVDEFQDTNPMQAALLNYLTGSQQNIMVVGDDDQSIYGWRGATLANILDFKKHYPKAQQVTLTENYRSTQAILDRAYTLIQHNNPHRLEVMNKLDKRLHAQSNDSAGVILSRVSSPEGELHWLAEQLQQRLKEGQDPASIAVLARRNHSVQRIHEFLEMYDIPHAVAGIRSELYKQVSVSQLIEALKAVNDPLDDLALFHTLGGPVFNMNASALTSIASASRRELIPLKNVAAVSDDEVMQRAMATLENWQDRSRELTVGELAYAILTESGWKQSLYEQAEEDSVVAVQVEALSQYFKSLKEFENITGIASVQAYLQNLPALKAAGNEFRDASLDISDTMLNVMSVHRAKGLEWETVFVVDCTEGSFPMRSFPSSLRLPDALRPQAAADDHMAEERRLMYVAMTRAKRELYLSYADRSEGSGAPRKPSRFLTELLGDEPEGLVIDMAGQADVELFAPTPPRNLLPLPEHFIESGNIALTVSQIETWLRCPQDFYYIYVQQTPLVADPAQQYGTLIHDVISKLHSARKSGKIPALDYFLDEVRGRLPKRDYVSVASRERAHNQALATVRRVYEIILEGDQPFAFEQPFRVAIPDSTLIMTGRFDAIYRADKGVEIRDYKTGTGVTTAIKAKQRATGSIQLSLYGLAWQLLNGEPPALLSLDFVETGLLGSVKKQAKSLQNLLVKIQAIVPRLESRQYPAGQDHTYCKHPTI